MGSFSVATLTIIGQYGASIFQSGAGRNARFAVNPKFKSLARILRGEIHTDGFTRRMLAADASIFQVIPAAVVYPRDRDDVVAAVDFARRSGLCVHARGAGSGLCGSALGRGIIIDFTRHMNRLLQLDRDVKTFTCQPGYRLGELNATLAHSGLFFPPDPSSAQYATLGGMYNTNASGSHAVKYGHTADYVVDAEIVLADGQVLRLSEISAAGRHLPPALQRMQALYTKNRGRIESAYPDVVANVCGYNLRGLVRNGRLQLGGLFAGSEGTLGIVTQLTFALAPRPAADCLVVAGFDDIQSAVRAVQALLPLKPSAIEIMDRSLLRLALETDGHLKDRLPRDVDNLLLIEFDGPGEAPCRRAAGRAVQLLREKCRCRQLKSGSAADEKAALWAVRKAAVPTLYRLRGRRKIAAVIEDAAVPVSALAPFFNGLYALLAHRRVDFVIYGHIAKGLLHTRPLLDLKSGRDRRLLKVLADDLFELVQALGGTVSGEHGDGRLRSAYIRRQYPGIHPLFAQVKQLLDPDGRLNPDIKTHGDPQQMQRDLRFGNGRARTRELPGRHLLWPGGFATAVESCHGCAKCTTVTTATRMCPVYKFTRQESATPRAKANLLRSLVSGAVAQRALYHRAFQKVMRQCVNCGSCRVECPSHVNIPKMAIEARTQYVHRFGARPQDRLLTSLEPAGRMACTTGGLPVLPLRLKGVQRAVRRIAGIAPERLPRAFARRSLTARLPAVSGSGRTRVLYFAGCYATYVRPEIGEAAVAVLTAMGLQVHLPVQHCCGLPMLSKGMARPAARKITQNLSAWRHLLKTVACIVVTCSSCGLALMREWGWLLPPATAARIRAKTLHISRLVGDSQDRLPLAPQKKRVAYHAPCHLRVQTAPQSSADLLAGIPGIEAIVLDSHCCGMAGSWGMAVRNAAVSTRLGQDLANRLAESRADVAATDCPTCRMQMEQHGALPVRHPVEILARSLETG